MSEEIKVYDNNSNNGNISYAEDVIATIAGVAALEQGGVRGSAMQAVQAAYRKTLELGK